MKIRFGSVYTQQTGMPDFSRPTQVRFCDADSNESYGIAYRDEIICGCCGGVFPLEEMVFVVPLTWIDFTDSIREED